MPITPSGPIALIQDINAVFDQGTEDITLLDAAVLAGLPSGEVSMTDFYGLSSEATLTLAFVDSTPTGASMSTSSISITATPGSVFSTQTRTVSRASNYIINSVSVSKSGDTGNNVSATGSLASGSTGFQNGLVTINGTIPNVDTTITLNVGASVSAKTSRGGSVSAPYYSCCLGSNGGYYFQTIYFAGGGTAGFYNGASTDGGGPPTKGWNNSSGTSGTQREGYIIAPGCCSLVTSYTGFSIGESATHASGSFSISKNH
jgi:hypothetical protein